MLTIICRCQIVATCRIYICSVQFGIKLFNCINHIVFFSDKDTICKTEDLPPAKLIPHPYLCTKFYICHPNATLRSEKYVYKYTDGNHVFNPATELYDYPENVACAVQESKFWTSSPVKLRYNNHLSCTSNMFSFNPSCLLCVTCRT